MLSDEWNKEAEKVQRLALEIQQARVAIRKEKKELRVARSNYRATLEARKILSGLAQMIQQKAHEKIAAVVTSCLHAVFDDPYDFRIIFEQKRGRTSARLIFERDGSEIDPMDAAGGGAVDVAAFALRAVCLVLYRPRLRQLLVLDEPFRNVSEEYRPAVREMIEKLSRDLKIQIIMVTHSDILETGKVIRL